MDGVIEVRYELRAFSGVWNWLQELFRREFSMGIDSGEVISWFQKKQYEASEIAIYFNWEVW